MHTEVRAVTLFRILSVQTSKTHFHLIWEALFYLIKGLIVVIVVMGALNLCIRY